MYEQRRSRGTFRVNDLGIPIRVNAIELYDGDPDFDELIKSNTELKRICVQIVEQSKPSLSRRAIVISNDLFKELSEFLGKMESSK